MSRFGYSPAASVGSFAIILLLVSCGQGGPATVQPDAATGEAPTDLPAAADAAGDGQDSLAQFPNLDPEACLPIDPADLAGIDPGYQPLSTGGFLADRNWYLLTLLLETPGVREALDADPVLSALSQDRENAFRKAAADCKGDPTCIAGALEWSVVEVESASDELAGVLSGADFKAGFIDGHLRGSGHFHLHHALDDPDMLKAAFEDTIMTLVDAFARYAAAMDAATLDSLVGDVAQANPGPLAFFEPILLVTVEAMLAAGRDEASRYEPLATGENGAAVARIGSIDWDGWRFPVILVPGWGPVDLSTPLSANGRDHCDLAAARWKAGVAPFILTTGGHVHPDGTPYSEAIEMKKYLMSAHGVPEDAVIVDPYARHTTTNLRNAARLMFRYGIPIDRPSLIATDVAQALYITALDGRCMDELGYLPYRRVVWLGEGDDCFLPDPASLHLDPRDPLDP